MIFGFHINEVFSLFNYEILKAINREHLTEIKDIQILYSNYHNVRHAHAVNLDIKLSSIYTGVQFTYI